MVEYSEMKIRNRKIVDKCRCHNMSKKLTEYLSKLHIHANVYKIYITVTMYNAKKQ